MCCDSTKSSLTRIDLVFGFADCINVRIFQFKDDFNTEKKIASKLKDCQEKPLLLGNEAELRLKLFDLLRVKCHSK